MKKPILLAVGGILAVLLLLFATFVGLLSMVFAPLKPVKTVMQTLPSPGGTHEARVIDVDEGALGGSTIVEVERNGWRARPKRVYVGEWGEYETMEIYWKNDDCLVINGKEYSVYG
jgi:hypothetical protein